VPDEDRPALTHALFKVYWVENRNVSDRSVLLDVARSVLPSTSTVSEAAFSSAEAQEALRDATTKVIARGAPGVPSFWVPGEKWTDAKGEARQGRLYWGQDRMHFVEAVLIALSRGVKYEEVPSLEGLQPRCLRPPPGSLQTRQTKLEFWYDFSSPWAFLGWTQLERLRREAGPGLRIEMKPILVGALFREYACLYPCE
jgi:2-hydroxychromene-2-carboxylate isomerase